LFTPDQFFFNQFIKLQRDDRRLLTETEYEGKYPPTIPLTEAEKKDLEKRIKEYQLETAPLRKSCPSGHRFGKDFDKEIDCDDCEKRQACQQYKD